MPNLRVFSISLGRVDASCSFEVVDGSFSYRHTSNNTAVMAELPLPVLADDQIKGECKLRWKVVQELTLRDLLPQNEQEVR